MSDQLFEANDLKSEPARPPDWLNVAARKKLGVGNDWRWCKAEWIGDDNLVEGAVPSLITRGPRKGVPTWKGLKLDRVIVTAGDLEQARADYESVTDKCHECAGSGLRNTGWSSESGRRFTPCGRCAATGTAPGGLV